MSDGEGTSTQEQQVVVEYKEGELEIVEYDKSEGSHMLGESSEGGDDFKYMQVVDSSGKNVVLDLLNMTLIKCENGGDSYQLVSSSSDCGDSETVTCILSNDDGEEDQYMVMDGDNGSLVYLESEIGEAEETQPEEKPVEKQPQKPQQPSPQFILERAKALQASKTIMSNLQRRSRGGRRRRGALPPPHELLALPQFRLYLYSCKLCPFKCNAVRELSAHKAAEHTGGGKWKAGGRSGSIALQCPRCPFRGNTHLQLSKHMLEEHHKNKKKDDQDYVIFGNKVYLSSAEVEAADVLVCGACGFESSSKLEFKKHIEEEHDATAC
ncbi:uncharacterized protein LOC123704115 [Colias croceus]|uniref:uncharacterized protein LOC123704115 n=1 Tax=Colias crocea TaxID=72248 RepID=UPI001E27DB4C|nr:uncharacterized protein LOC123704115 [Colias croceus]XP_045508362.1 uncharacterized protein LOC123704115 [Colias croceus]XP_045508363.1 uncharacterized protein LOC123704115 [Colias croceus]